MRTLQILALLAVGALIGFAVFGLLTWRQTTVEKLGREDALFRMEETRALFGDEPPLIDVEAEGRIVRRRYGSPIGGPPPDQMVILAYRAQEERLVRVDVPFWFVRLKGPAAEFALRDTGFDLKRLHVTPAELADLGPSLILDEMRPNGDRLLVWTE